MSGSYKAFEDPQFGAPQKSLLGVPRPPPRRGKPRFFDDRRKVTILGVICLITAAIFAILVCVFHEHIPTEKVACAVGGADIAWMLLSTMLVLLMILALGFFESGLLRSKNTLSILMQMFSGLSILSVLWFICGFSLTFGPDSRGFIGNFKYAFFMGVSEYECMSYAPRIPGLAFATFQMMFAVITPLLVTGAFAERLKFGAFLSFIVVWSICVYYPLAHWIWGDGWLSVYPVLDFAGGITIHTSAGTSAVVSAIMLGKRKDWGKDAFTPHNVPLAVMGATLLWLGWFGFNAGSTFMADALTTSTFVSTHIASCTSALVWLIIPWIHEKKARLVEVVNGAIAGLAGITPASGYVTPQSAFVIGIIIGLGSYGSVYLLKHKLKIDDALDVSSVHGVPGIIGALALGFAASLSVNPGGANGVIYGNPIQLAYQLFGVVLAIIWSGVVTIVILSVIDWTIGLRVPLDVEEAGLDEIEHGELAYQYESTDNLTARGENPIPIPVSIPPPAPGLPSPSIDPTLQEQHKASLLLQRRTTAGNGIFSSSPLKTSAQENMFGGWGVMEGEGDQTDRD